MKMATKVLARIDIPKFKKHPLISISIGGDGNKLFGYTRGENFGVLCLLGIYISIRRPYDPSVAFGMGVEEGFKASEKLVSYLVAKVNNQAIMINKMASMMEDTEDEEEEDDNGFNPQWN
jgi:hypothetical protein